MSRGYPFHRFSCINRIILEFKDKAELQARGISIVLIESYWNLKSEPERVYCVPCSGINRIILEFKVRSETLPAFLVLVLIESYWNLKKSRPNAESILYCWY